MSSLLHEVMKGGQLSLTIVLRSDIEGGFIAERLEIPGCLSEGNSEDEATANIRDAVDACLSVMLEDAIQSAPAQREVNLVGIQKQFTVTIEAPHIAANASAS